MMRIMEIGLECEALEKMRLLSGGRVMRLEEQTIMLGEDEEEE